MPEHDLEFASGPAQSNLMVWIERGDQREQRQQQRRGIDEVEEQEAPRLRHSQARPTASDDWGV